MSLGLGKPQQRVTQPQRSAASLYLGPHTYLVFSFILYTIFDFVLIANTPSFRWFSLNYIYFLYSNRHHICNKLFFFHFCFLRSWCSNRIYFEIVSGTTLLVFRFLFLPDTLSHLLMTVEGTFFFMFSLHFPETRILAICSHWNIDLYWVIGVFVINYPILGYFF